MKRESKPGHRKTAYRVPRVLLALLMLAAAIPAYPYRNAVAGPAGGSIGPKPHEAITAQTTILAAGDDTTPPNILHDLAGPALRGNPVVIVANILDRSELHAATLFYKNHGDAGFKAVTMRQGSDRLYRARIPAEATAKGKIAYYFEAVDIRKNGPARLGSPESPLELFLDSRSAAGMVKRDMKSAVLFLLAVCLSMSSVVMAARLKERKQTAAAASRRFWEELLTPLICLPGPIVSRKVTELSRKPVFHPVFGIRIFARVEILKQLWLVKKEHHKKTKARRSAKGTHWRQPIQSGRQQVRMPLMTHNATQTVRSRAHAG